MHNATSPVEEYLLSCIEQRFFPSAVYLVAVGDSVLTAGAAGNAVISPETIPATSSTIYDLASLTKPLITALLAVRLLEKGMLDLSLPASLYLPEFLQTGKASITIQQLLTHSSGLPSWLPLAGLAVSSRNALQTISVATLVAEPGSRVIYSDLGYIAAGILIERVAGKPLDRLAREEILEPLGLDDAQFRPSSSLRARIAATEGGNQYEIQKAREFGVSIASRPSMIWGEVHDGNAFFLGGVAGHAGLFAKANDVLTIATQFLPGGSLIRSSSLSLCTENRTRGLGEERSIGWQLAVTPDCSAGAWLSPSSFGHTGFTGTSVWIDPEKDAIFLLLTNRVHPRVTSINMNAIRRRFHDLAAELL